MQFIVKAYDGKDMLEKRMEVRPRHLEGMKALGKQIICAGGLLDEEGRMKGSALVMEFENRAALDAYRDALTDFLKSVRENCASREAPYMLLDSEKSFEESFIPLLSQSRMI